MDNIGIIILAAGPSSRLGRAKQLLPFGGTSLVAHIADQALEADLEPVIVVTGAYTVEVIASLGDRPVIKTYNPRWAEGMASGIVAGLAELLSVQPRSQGAIIAVCDQPHLSTGLLEDLKREFSRSDKGIVASTYMDTVGTPVLFGYRYFQALSALSGSEGAKKLLKAHPDDIATVAFPGGEIDIDTPEDFRKLSSFTAIPGR